MNKMLNDLSVNNSGCMLRKGTSTTLVPINIETGGDCAKGVNVLGNTTNYPNLQFYDLGANGELGEINYPLGQFCQCLPDGADLSSSCGPGTENLPECISKNPKDIDATSVSPSCTNVTVSVTDSPAPSNSIPRCKTQASNSNDIVIYEFQLRSGIGALVNAIPNAFGDAGKAIKKIIMIVVIVIISIVALVVFFKVILPLIINASHHHSEGSDVNVNIKGGHSSSNKKSSVNTRKKHKLKFDNWRI
jgi:hypothetical protein